MTPWTKKYMPLAFFIAGAGWLAVEPLQVEAAEADGQLVILDERKNDGTYPTNCVIPFVTSQIDFQDDSFGCTNDEAYAFKLENVPSATYFLFSDSPSCTDSGNFYYRFKTIKQPTHMDQGMEIEVAGRKEEGSVAVPGVMVIASKTTGQVGGKLSCVKIERSAVPTP